MTLRNRAEVARFLDGLEILDPGVVPLNEWRPGGDDPIGAGDTLIPIYGAVAHEP